MIIISKHIKQKHFMEIEKELIVNFKKFKKLSIYILKNKQNQIF